MKVDKLRGIIVSEGMTQEQVARQIGMSPKTFYNKMKKGVFGTDEVLAMVELLDIDDPADIIFKQGVTLEVALRGTMNGMERERRGCKKTA